ncbi:DIP1984 family protein [Agreia sp. PsM10]|uniref:DIP1984 family protein n=1 Tax=Agreia sp. PsM10 TaxID=3030533 RepID=UPI00345EEF2A
MVRTMDAATGVWVRSQTRTKLRQISALPVKKLRKQLEAVTKHMRDICLLIQRTSWAPDLLRGRAAAMNR